VDSSHFTFGSNSLTSQDGNSIMMEWERDWMKRVAEIICSKGGDILNIGFGMGIVDSFISDSKIESHTIMEVHPDVLTYMKDNGWYKKAQIIEGDWRTNIDKLKLYDGIFFDTFGGNREDFFNGFLLKLKTLLKVGGIFTFWYPYNKENISLNTFCNDNDLSIEYIDLPVDIPEQQHKNGKAYIDPKLQNVLIPAITNNSNIAFNKNFI